MSSKRDSTVVQIPQNVCMTIVLSALGIHVYVYE